MRRRRLIEERNKGGGAGRAQDRKMGDGRNRGRARKRDGAGVTRQGGAREDKYMWRCLRDHAERKEGERRISVVRHMKVGHLDVGHLKKLR